MQPPWLLLTLALTLANGSSLAQQPVRPLPKVGGCPIGYDASGSYCVPSASDNTRSAIEKTGSSCPLGFYGSGNFCVCSTSNDREAIQKTGNSCPRAHDSVVTEVLVQGRLVAAGHPLAAVLVGARAAELLGTLRRLLLDVMKPSGVGFGG